MSYLFGDADKDLTATPQPNERPDLPTTFADTFMAEWSHNNKYSNDYFGEQDRFGALQDYIDNIKQRTGVDVGKDLDFGDTSGIGVMPAAQQMREQVNAKLAKLKQDNPTIDIQPMSADELSENGLDKRRKADADFAALMGRERGPGATFGEVTGALTSAVGGDPINAALLPIAPEESLGVVANFLKWGAFGGAGTAVSTALQAPYQEQVTPGYIASGQPLVDVATSAAEVGAGGVLARGLAMAVPPIYRAVAGAWDRAMDRPGIPESVKQAGNVVASQANVIATNVYPGPEGDAAHAAALVKTNNDIFAGRPVDVSKQITPELDATAARPAIEAARVRAQETATAAAQARTAVPAEGRQLQFPFAQTETERQAEAARQNLAGDVQIIARQAAAPYDMPAEEAARIADKLTRATPAEAQDLMRDLHMSPRQVADAPTRIEPPAEPVPMKVTPISQASPELHDAMRADLDREVATGRPIAAEDYAAQARRSLEVTSRTAAQGRVDTTVGGEAKAAALIGEKTPDQLKALAQGNFEQTIKQLYDERAAMPTTGPEMEKKIDEVAASINRGIVKPEALDRTHETKFAGQTAVADLAAAKKQFAEEFAQRLNDPNADPIETAAWVEWRANLLDHFWSDGSGRTAKALAAIPMMRAGLPLPEPVPMAAHAAFAPSAPGKYAGPEFQRYSDFYHELAGVPRPAAGSKEELQRLIDQKAPRETLINHPFVQDALRRNQDIEPTGTAEDFLNPTWRAKRVYDFDGTPVQGFNNARELLKGRFEAAAGPEGVAHERRVTFVTGPPASGKSTFAVPLARELRAAIPDPDDAKLVIPEYQGGLGTLASHEESSRLAREATAEMALRGTNFVIPTVGGTAEHLQNTIQAFKNAGYKVDLMHVSAGAEVSSRRNIQRLINTGRLVEPNYLLQAAEKTGPTAYMIRGKGLIDDFADIDTSGETPVVRGGEGSLAEMVRTGRYLAERPGGRPEPIFGATEGLRPPGAVAAAGGTAAARDAPEAVIPNLPEPMSAAQALRDVDAYKAVAEQIGACAAPVAQAA